MAKSYRRFFEKRYLKAVFVLDFVNGVFLFHWMVIIAISLSVPMRKGGPQSESPLDT